MTCAFLIGVGCTRTLSHTPTLSTQPSTQPTAGTRAAGVATALASTAGSSNDGSAPRRATKGVASTTYTELTLAIKFVNLTEPNSKSDLVWSQVAPVIDRINRIYERCRIRFVVEQFGVVNPDHYGLARRPSQLTELDRIRSQLNDTSRLLVVTTEKWDRSNDLGSTPANAWTAMPGIAISGTVMEATYADHPSLLAHELGHALGLTHEASASNVMNSTIASDSDALSQAQCDLARSGALTYRSKALRF